MMKKILTPPQPKDDRLYNILIISMIVALIIVTAGAYYFRTTLYAKDDWFGEIYFTEPTELPNLVRINQPKNFTFGIKSHEEEPINYTYYSGINLYTVYEIAESRYSCLSRFRNHYFLDVTNETANISLINQPQQYPQIQKLMVLPNYKKMIKNHKTNLI